MAELTESTLRLEQAASSLVVPAGDGHTMIVKKGQTFRIVDLEGNQAVDTLFYSAARPGRALQRGRHHPRAGQRLPDHGHALMSTEGNVLLTIVADTCGRHDTLGGACAAESNTVRYALEKRYMHSCRDSFLLALACSTRDMTKRDIAPNINFFMNVPVTPEGGLTFADGVSGPGRYVEMRAEMDVLVLISNCPQLNNPCNAYNPTPVAAADLGRDSVRGYDVRKRPDRQPRRDRLPHHPHA